MLSKRLLVTTVLSVAALLCAVGTTALPAAASTTSGAAVPNPGGPIVRAPASSGASSSSVPTISLNWSGYAATSSQKFTYVHTRFVQPAITCVGNPSQYTSNWSGLDGFTTGTVEQDGTFAFCGKTGTTPQYVAWYELFPAPSINVFSVRPGDTIDSSVRYANGKFTLRIADLTLGKSVTHTAACSDCARASAEWIIERPALCTNQACTKAYLTELANFHTSTMGQDTAQVAGGKVTGVASFVNYPIFMVTPLKKGFISLDTVGPLSGASFTAVWDRPGSTVPISL